MKCKCLITLLVLVMLTAATTHAAGDWWYETTGWFEGHFYRTPSNTSGDLFNPQEFSLDVFGSFYDDDRRVGRSVLRGQCGGGIGGNYFVTRELGVTLDTNIADNGRSFFDYFHASAVFRWPFEECKIAPYALIGIGYDFDPNDELTEHAGVGAEYRLNPITGIFADTRYVFTDKSTDYWVFRIGVRFVF
ncbi:MAG: hypothetical protein JWQ71_2667 [Pedosphaera sp.]|nr:hypothetical protein [Pedosphaera sp.]